jgi:hypothetical protein
MTLKKTAIPAGDKIISYSKLRAFIGITGILLPVLAFFGTLFTGAEDAALQKSISHYYYSKMHIVFVGTLCVLGGFLISYYGTNKWESRLSNLAGICAFGIAACPTTIKEFIPNKNIDNLYLELCVPVTSGWGTVHFVFVGVLFACFTTFCLWFFQKPDDEYKGEDLVKFKRRQRIYTICGWVIIVSIVLIAVFSFVLDINSGFFAYSTFIFETTSLWAFGFAWLVKGSDILKNVPVAKQMVKAIR